jgi:hypothetical protein
MTVSSRSFASVFRMIEIAGRACSPYRDIEIPFTTEELKRFASELGGRPLAEILADLEKRS